MTAVQAILLDHAVALAGVIAWYAAAVATMSGRRRLALGLLGLGVLATVARAGTVAQLAGHGWWFVQEKALLTLPVSAVATVAAVVLAAPVLARHSRTTAGVSSRASVVALFSAGHAGLAGLAVTVGVGYPLTAGATFLAMAAVGLAVLLTARVLQGEPTESAAGSEPWSRRRFLGVAAGLCVLGAGALGGALSLVSPPRTVSGGGPGPSASRWRSVAELRGATTPAPGGRVHRHVLTAQASTIQLASGRTVQGWTYGGSAPGPAIVAALGDLVDVTLRNIPGGVTIHWHGYDVPCGEDGAPGATQAAVLPGEEFRYHFRADQAGTYWYHTHQTSHVGVRRGLYGTLVVTPRQSEPANPGELDLVVPVHSFDGILAIGDDDGVVRHNVAPGTAVRLRVINTDSDPHEVVLVGAPFRLEAVDGRDLNGPDTVRDARLRLPAGGRFDLALASTCRLPPSPLRSTTRARVDCCSLRPKTASTTGSWKWRPGTGPSWTSCSMASGRCSPSIRAARTATSSWSSIAASRSWTAARPTRIP